MNKAHLLDSQSFYSKPVNDDRRCPPPPKYNVYNVILFWQMMNVSATFENVFLAFLTFLTFKFFSLTFYTVSIDLLDGFQLARYNYFNVHRPETRYKLKCITAAAAAAAAGNRARVKDQWWVSVSLSIDDARSRPINIDQPPSLTRSTTCYWRHKATEHARLTVCRLDMTPANTIMHDVAVYVLLLSFASAQGGWNGHCIASIYTIRN